jgi:hypothetical protein
MACNFTRVLDMSTPIVLDYHNHKRPQYAENIIEWRRVNTTACKLLTHDEREFRRAVDYELIRAHVMGVKLSELHVPDEPVQFSHIP